MPYRIGWYVENQVIYSHFWGTVTVDDMISALGESSRMVEKSGPALVHIITNVSDVTVPLAARDLPKVVANGKTPPNTGWVITVGEKDVLMKFVSSVARQLFRLHQRAFDTMEQTLKFLHDIDGAVDWSKADESVFNKEIQGSQ